MVIASIRQWHEVELVEIGLLTACYIIDPSLVTCAGPQIALGCLAGVVSAPGRVEICRAIGPTSLPFVEVARLGRVGFFAHQICCNG